jgi:hypothetical protein
MLKAMLVSPQFLFITPAGEAERAPGSFPLDDYQLASRLSYLLWATMPDDELMALADSGKLHEPAVLKAQVKRLLEDPRSRALFDGFGAQWLGVGGLQRQVFDPAMFPQMTARCARRCTMKSACFSKASCVKTRASSVSSIAITPSSMEPGCDLRPGENGQGPEMRKVRLSDSNRGGVLGMPGILAATSFPNRTSPVKRGVWVLEQVLGEHVPAAPPDVPALDNRTRRRSPT